MNLFGKPKAKAPKLTDSIAQLKEAIDTLEKREKHLEKQAEEALNKAKLKSKKGDKKGALFELKRKKMFEQQIESMFGKRVNLETQIMAIQSASANKDVLQAMKTGRDAIKAHVNDKVIDEVANVMDDINENVSMINEMDQALSQPVGNILDDDDLEAELNELEDQMNEQDLLNADHIDVPAAAAKEKSKVDFPSAPAGRKPEVKVSQEDDELAALEAELA